MGFDSLMPIALWRTRQNLYGLFSKKLEGLYAKHAAHPAARAGFADYAKLHPKTNNGVFKHNFGQADAQSAAAFAKQRWTNGAVYDIMGISGLRL